MDIKSTLNVDSRNQKTFTAEAPRRRVSRREWRFLSSAFLIFSAAAIACLSDSSLKGFDRGSTERRNRGPVEMQNRVEQPQQATATQIPFDNTCGGYCQLVGLPPSCSCLPLYIVCPSSSGPFLRPRLTHQAARKSEATSVCRSQENKSAPGERADCCEEGFLVQVQSTGKREKLRNCHRFLN